MSFCTRLVVSAGLRPAHHSSVVRPAGHIGRHLCQLPPLLTARSQEPLRLQLGATQGRVVFSFPLHECFTPRGCLKGVPSPQSHHQVLARMAIRRILIHTVTLSSIHIHTMATAMHMTTLQDCCRHYRVRAIAAVE